MSSKKIFTKQVLASLVSAMSVAGVTYSGSAFAQDQDQVVEEVTVVGIRGSLQRSMDIKRDSTGVVDAISAEDMGKFPDSNIAESMQRISGVSISRRNGEGSQVTVRGFGPDFNMITLNGRIMPASSLNQNGGGDNSSRAFDMDNIASEGVRGVEVYKTGKAHVVSGGIGATINLKTMRPLDEPGFKMSVGAKALADQTNRIGDDVTPEVSGLFSWSDDDGRFGAALSLSRQERDSAASGAYVVQWSGNQAYNGTYPLSLPTNADGSPQLEGPLTQIENEPSTGQIVGNPSDLRYFHADRERTRTNGQLTFQFRPVESVTATLDYTYAEQEIYENRSELSSWFQDFPRTNLVFDDAASPTPVLFWEESRDPRATAANPNPDPRLPRDIGFALQQQNQKNQLESIGFNIDWAITDALSVAFDAHNSTSESTPNADYGNWINTGLGANISDQQGADWTGDLPIMMVSFNDSFRGANGNGVLDIADVGSSVRQLNRNSSKTEISQMRLDGKFEMESGNIDFGIESRSMENLGRTAFDQTLLEGGWGIGNPGDVPAEFLDPINYASLFDGYSLNSSNQAWFDEVSGNTAAPLTQGFYGDAAVVGAHLAEAAGIPFSTSHLVDTTNRRVAEDVFSLYVQYTGEFELGGFPASIVAGLRYEETDVRAESRIAVPNVVWEGNNDFKVVAGDAANPDLVSGTGSYDHLLPNLDLAIDFRDDLKGRLSYSKTIARSTYNNLSVGATVAGGPTLPTYFGIDSQPGTATNGDPGLLPLESDNYDIGLEWYIDDTSYVSAGYFEKNISNFVGTQAVPANVFGIRDPSNSNSPRVQAAVAALGDAGIPVDATTLFSMMAAQSVGEDYNSRTAEEWENLVDFTGDANDPLMTFTTQVPQNINNAKINGFEIGGQHFFGETGFGIQGNYTIVDGNVGFDVTVDPSSGSQFALLGLSDTANLSLMYEKERFQSRVSYNWRDEFLNSTAVTGNEPEFTEAYSQIDFSMSYEAADGLFVSLEGINITEEDQRKFGRSKRQLTRLEVLGARYALGVRYTF